MPEQRHVFRLSRSLVVVLPPAVQRHLGIGRGGAVHWYLVRKGEAVLSPEGRRAGGHPEGAALRRQLTSAWAEIALLKSRNEARDRSMYAEGYNVGHQKATEALMRPHGASAERQRRRKLRAYIFPDAVEQERRARRRGVETAPGPDQFLGPPGPAPDTAPTWTGGEAATPEAKPTTRPVES